MQLLLFLVVYPVLLLLSFLPFRILYILSDIVCFFVYRIFSYRKTVVRENLAIALPHLSEKQRLEIEKKSYKHLCDMFLEMIKTMSISPSEIEKRFVYKNLEVYNALEAEGKSISLLCAHYASYEWAVSLNSKIGIKGYAIYKKLNNKYFDKLVRKIRSKFNATLIHIKETVNIIEKNYNDNKKCLYGFASDQSPQLKLSNYWGKFMGIEVPIYIGAEVLSKKYDMNMIFLKVKKVKRGYYEAEFEVLSNNVNEIPDFEIMDVFLKKVEQQILEEPAYYLWTHRRWKHREKND